jgi:transposase insI for insertion sequence element IS30B/C/D
MKMEDRSKNSILETIKQLTTSISKETFKTFTSGRGKDFSCLEEVEKMGIDFYFADPYCS